jgi:transposase
MSFNVEQKIGKTVYVYEVTSYWDKEKNQPRQKRKILGKRDLVTGKLIKTSRNGKNEVVKIEDYGNMYFLNNLWEQIKLKEAVEKIYPEEYEEIKTLVNYVISESKPYYLFSTWVEYNYTEVAERKISSQRISELLEKLGNRNNRQDEFFELWIKQQKEIDAVYFDITSISTYSRQLAMAEWGYNRDKEKLRQINLGITYGVKTELPLYYKIYQGSISDVSTLKNLVKYNQEYGIKDMVYILDRGFYSKSNLRALEGEKVVIPLVFHSKEAKEILEENKDLLLERKRIFSYGESLYYYVKGQKEIEGKKYYYYIFRNKERYNEQETTFLKMLMEIESKIMQAKYKESMEVEEHIENITKGYSKYFEIKEKDGYYYVEQKSSEIEKRIRRFGTFILITNQTDTTEIEILRMYRIRDRIEKIFDNMKNDLDRNRLRVNQESRVRGSLFITFLSLILLSHIENKIRESNVLKKMTKQEIFYELKKIKITQFNDGFHLINEVSRKSKDIFNEFSIVIPDS